MQEFKKEYGEDQELEEGDEFVTVFDNCTLIMSLDDGIIKTKFLEGRPYEVSMDIDIYKEGVSGI